MDLLPRADTLRVAVPPAEPGSVVSFVLPSIPPGTGPVTYRYLPGPRVRAIGIAPGEPVEWAAQRGPFAFAFALPRAIPAGVFDAGTVVTERPGMEPWVVRLEGSVLQRFRLETALVPVSAVNIPGGEARLRYSVRNLGNATDTVQIELRPDAAWTTRDLPLRVAIAPGDSAVGEARLGIPETATPGATNVVQLAVTGREGTPRISSGSVLVSGSAVLAERWTRLTTDVFVGGAADSRWGGDGIRPALVVRSTGRLGQSAELEIHGRQGAPYTSVPVFQRFLYAPEILVSLRAPAWSAAAGDVVGLGPRLGGVLQGRGVAGSIRAAGVETRGLLAGGAGPAGGEGGHTAHLAVRADRAGARFGASASDVDQPAWLGGTRARVQSVLGTLEMVRSDQSLSVEVGWLRVGAARDALLTGSGILPASGAPRPGSDSARSYVAGPAVDAMYSVYGRAGSVNARLRHVPATAAGADLRGNEAVIAGRLRVAAGAELFGTAAATSDPRIGAVDPFRTNSAQVGSRLSGTGRYVDVAASVSRSEQSLPRARSVDRASVLSSAGLTGRAFGVHLSGEVGHEQLRGAALGAGTEDRRLFASLQGTARYQGSGGYLAASAARRHYPFGGSPVTLDVYGGLQRRGFELEGGANLAVAEEEGWRDGVGARLGASYEVVGGTVLVGGVDVRPGVGSGTQLTLGVRRRVGVVVPIPVATALSGTVYHDRNGDGVRDPGEPGLPGVVVGLGYLRATSDANGRYAFPRDLPGADVVVDPVTLPASLRVPPARLVRTAATRQLDLPATEAARLALLLRLDRNRNGLADPDEPAATDAHVTLLDPEGRRRDAQPDTAGRLALDGLLPGRYRIEVAGAMVGERRPEPSVDSLVLAPGERVERVVVVRDASRQIRFGPRNAPQPAPPEPGTPPKSGPSAASPPGEEACLRVLFRSGSASARGIDRAARRALGCLPPAPQAICLVGRTDDLGSTVFNDRLARRRALFVRDALVRAGVEGGRLKVQARGEREIPPGPLSPDARATYRVVEIGSGAVCADAG